MSHPYHMRYDSNLIYVFFDAVFVSMIVYVVFEAGKLSLLSLLLLY